ncbi:MAG: hemerythrin domain-containing protein [Myxococcales bacterium]|nr:hemerythrin domain-containing protein [Myxococcales bacterium]
MSKTKMFRDQHDDLLKAAAKLKAELNADKIGKDAVPAKSALSQLLGKLSVHLAMEDKSLYPQLLKHSDQKVKTTASRFVSEMGAIGKVLADYQKAWPSDVALKQNPRGFVQQTTTILDALAKRIEKENGELYKMVDTLA